MIMTVIKDTKSRIIARSIKPDTKNRVVLPKVLIRDGVTYDVYVNDHDQIILDPQVTVSLSELWIFENKELLNSIDRGMAQAANGETVNLDSFSRYADDES